MRHVYYISDDDVSVSYWRLVFHPLMFDCKKIFIFHLTLITSIIWNWEMSCTTNLCIISASTVFEGRSKKPRKLNSASSPSTFSNPAYSSTSLSFSGSFNFTYFTITCRTASFPMATSISVNVNASSTVGIPFSRTNTTYTASLSLSLVWVCECAVIENSASVVLGKLLVKTHRS